MSDYILFYFLFLANQQDFRILQQCLNRNNNNNINQIRKTKRNVTKMVIYTSVIFLLGNTLVPVVVLASVAFNLKTEGYLFGVSLFSNTLKFVSYGFNMFVCYYFNNKFRCQMRKMILRKKSD